MRTVSAREANQQFSKLLEAAAAGEEIVITRRGLPVARLVPCAVGHFSDAEERRRAAIEWLRSGPLSGPAPSWTRDELYERDGA
ncbi:MAG: type II toxin-antitoxin system Phd/YefM family antitoxin [Geminicoccaceae bacterium]